ncbi:MAG: hypothetical protein ACOYL6_02610 [Bacteriovoracaceae bacterium]
MKNILFLFTILLSTKLFAAEGVVKVLEAPLFRSEDDEGAVVQYVRKGDKIYIHDAALRGEDYVPLETVFSEADEIIEKKKKIGGKFYATIDNQGRVAYIPKVYIDLTFKDEREFEHEKLAQDHTDYRLKEPLPKDYPLYSPTGYKSFITMGFGPNPKNNYQYPSRIRKENFGQNFDVTATMLMKASRDYSNRFYYGGMVHLLRDQSKFELESGSAEEIEFKAGVGPYISYDPFVGEKFRFTLYTALIYNLFNVHGVAQTTEKGYKEGRAYTGTTFSPRFGFIVNFSDIYPELMDQFDFLVGTSIMTEYPRKLTSRQAPAQRGLWQAGAGDQISNAALTATLFIGLQKRY